jgi:hypothetical protein
LVFGASPLGGDVAGMGDLVGKAVHTFNP